jgi:hypothetical protein
MVQQGIADLAQSRITDFSLLVLIAARRLRDLGIEVPDRRLSDFPEHALYERLEDRLGTAAHSYYNSLLRRVVSYAHALDREKSQRDAPR